MSNKTKIFVWELGKGEGELAVLASSIKEARGKIYSILKERWGRNLDMKWYRKVEKIINKHEPIVVGNSVYLIH